MIRTAIICAAALASFTAISPAAAQLKPMALEVDEYKTPDLSAHTDNLDNWAIELQNDPGAQGYVIAYAPRAVDAQKAAANQVDYAVEERGIIRNRVSMKNGGYRTVPSIELWILHNGAAPPKPRPAVKRKH